MTLGSMLDILFQEMCKSHCGRFIEIFPKLALSSEIGIGDIVRTNHL
jgi:hypothetical protein